MNEARQRFNPLAMIDQASSTFPGIWNTIQGLYKLKHLNKHADFQCPDYCLFYYDDLMVGIEDLLKIDLEEPDNQGILSTFLPIICWRYSKGFYEFDRELINSFLDIKYDVKLPSFVITRLPEWGMYIDLENAQPVSFAEDLRLLGFWVTLVSKREDDHPWVCIVTNEIDVISGDHNIEYHCYPLLEGSIIDIMQQGCIAAHGKRDLSLDNDLMNDVDLGNDVNRMAFVFNCLLYLCSSEPEIKDKDGENFKPYRGKVVNRNKKFKFFQAPKPRYFDVGKELGDTVREGRSRTYKGRSPHLRRAHWHGYWKGPRNGDREFIYKWIPPTFVMPRDIKLTK